MIIFLLFLYISFSPSNAEQCVTDKNYKFIHPFCNNASRTADFVMHSDSSDVFTCTNSIYDTASFPLTHTSEQEDGLAFVGGNVTPYKYAICRVNGLVNNECNILCGVEAFFHNRTGAQNLTHTKCMGDGAWCHSNTLNGSCYGVTIAYPQCYCTAYTLSPQYKTYYARNNVYCRAGDFIAVNESANDVFNKIAAVTPIKEIVNSFIDFDGKIVYAKTKEDCNCFLEAKKDSWYKYIKFTGSEAYLSVDDIALIKSGNLIVNIKDDDGSEEEKVFPIVGQKLCRLHDCVLCYDSFNHFSCLPTAIKTVLIVIICLLSLLFLSAFPQLIYFLFLLIKGIVSLIAIMIKLPRRVWRSTMMKKIKELMSSTKKAIIADEESQSLKDDIEDLQNISKPKKKSNSTKYEFVRPSSVNTLTVQTLLSIMLLPLVFADVIPGCTEVTDIRGEVTLCTGFYPERANCSMSFEDTLQFNNMNQKLCRRVIDEKGHYVGFLQITLVQVQVVVDVSSIYYTSDYKVVSQSSHRCYGAGTCSNATCASVQTRNAGGELTLTDLTNYPGITKCHRGAGCAANGCLLCVDGCVFTGYALIPEGPVYQVFDPYTITNQPMLFINFTSGNNYQVTDFITLDSAYLDIGMFSFQIESSFINTDYDFQDYKIITEGRNHYFSRANDPNKYNKQVIGDIQSSTADDLEFPTVNFGFDIDAYSFVSQGKYDSIDYQQSGLKYLKDEDKLPLVKFGQLWTFDTVNRLVSNLTKGIQVDLTMKSGSSFNFSDFVSTVCPKGNVENAAGCYNCDIGSNVNLTLYSICDEGLVSITTTDPTITIVTTTVSISKSKTNYLIEFLTTQEKNNFDLVVTGSSIDLSLNVVFEAVDVTSVITNETYVVDNNDEEPTHNGISGAITNFFDKAFLGSGHWIAYLIISAIVTGVILLTIFLCRKNRSNIISVYNNKRIPSDSRKDR